MTKEDYQNEVTDMRSIGLELHPERFCIKIGRAEDVLKVAMEEIIGKCFVWLPEYAEVAEWLTDNKGKGLLLMGNCGRGKTIIGRNILTCILHHYYRIIPICIDAADLATESEKLLKSKAPICVDDLGVERDTKSRTVFERIVDQMEKQGRLLIVTTNLTGNDIQRTYGDRVLDRLKGCTRCVVFGGVSLRGGET